MIALMFTHPRRHFGRGRRGVRMSVDEEAVRQLAELIWETEGKPHGQEARHWDMATRLAESAAMAPARSRERRKADRRKPDTLFPSPDNEPGQA